MPSKTVLVVEDDFRLLRLYSRIIKMAGYTVHQAATVQAAVELLSKHDYDVCITDMEIGYHKGLDVLSIFVPSLDRGAHMIVVSGYDHYRDVATSIGADFLIKPVDKHDLIEIIESSGDFSYA